MKRIIAIILAALMLISFASCKASNGTGNDTTVEEETKAEAGKETEAETTEKEEETPEFSLGVSTGGTYVNNYLGLGCKLSDEWTFYNEEQIRNINNLTADIAGEDYQKLMEEADVVIDMYAIHSNGFDSINVTLEKVGLAGVILYDVKKSLEASIDMLKSTFKNMGYENIECEIIKVEFAGEEYTALRTTATTSGVQMYQTTVADIRGLHVFNITATTYNEDTTDKLLDTFYKLK